MSGRIRVLWLIKGLGLGGAEMLLARAVPYLDRERFEYEVAYLLPQKSTLVSSFEAEDLPVHCLGGGPSGLRWIANLRRLLRAGSYDIVHVHSPVAASAARVLARINGGNGSRPKLYYTEHNVWNRYHRATYLANALTFPLNDHVVAVSDAVARSVRQLPGVRPKRVHTVYQGIDYAHVSKRTPTPWWREPVGIPFQAPLVVSVGNLKGHKGHDILISAARDVVREVPEAHFVIVGTGQEETNLRALIRRLRLNDHVHLVGFREDALDLVGDADVFALASRNEGLSIALLEAMALGVPVVATNVGGVPEAVEHGIDGFTVPPRDPAVIARHVVKLLHDPGLRAEMGAAGRERAKLFDIAGAARRREGMYLQLVAHAS